MIRTKHEIDTKLLNIFITDKVFDDEVNELLIDWYSSLGDTNHQKTREKAIDFLKRAANKVLIEIDYPHKQRSEIVRIFEPLELLLRTALTLKTSNEKAHNVRDHLSHTIRNILFSNYLLKKFSPPNYSSLRTQLIISVIFHDLAYPIEKIKKVAHKIGNATFRELLNSKGNIEIELDRPDDLLTLLDFFGRLRKFKQKEIQILESEGKTDGLGFKKDLISKIDHIYREVISKAIAGVGLFDSSHSISSVVLFLLPIVKNSSNPQNYQDENLNVILDISLSMTYHDRGNIIQNISGFDLPLNLRIMRITDELQEWDREQNSFIKDVIIENDVTTVLSMKMEMKDKSKKELCAPEFFLPDKINGLLPSITGNETIKLQVQFPREIDLGILEKKIKDMKAKLKLQGVDVLYTLGKSPKGKNVDLIFLNNSVDLKIYGDE